MGEDILSVIFLVLVCIVVSSIAYRLAPGQMMVPTFALIAVCLWISLDFILMKRHKARAACKAAHNHSDSEVDAKISELTSELNFVDDKDINNHSAPKIDTIAPAAKHASEFDIDLYDKGLSIQELYKDMGCSGDTKIANRMKYMGLQERMAQDIRSRWNVEKLRPYLEEELSDNEHRDWWDNEVEHLDNLM